MKQILSDNEIKMLAQELDSPADYYINTKTGEVLEIPTEEILDAGGEDLWEDVLTHFNEVKEHCVPITKMTSHESFQVMKEFAENLKDLDLQDKLIDALDRSKPFRNFRKVLEYSAYLDKWYDFQLESSIEFVKNQIREIEDSEASL